MALDFVAGLFGGAAGVLAGHPFDTVKARLQTQHIGGAYRGTIHCAREIIRKESFLGLYKGISAPLAGLAFINAVVFSVYGTSQKYFTSLYGEKNLGVYFCAGCSAGLVQSLICSPMEMAKLRLQLQGQGVWSRHIFFYLDPPLRYSGPIDCLRKVYKLEGTRGLFRGLPLTVARDGPGFGIYFASYAWLTNLMTSGGPESLTTGKLLCAGGAAGMMSWLFLYPIDVVKSRFQADDKFEYKNSWHCAVKSCKTEGWGVFSHGLCSTLLRAFPTNAFTLFTVEWIFRISNGYLTKNMVQQQNNSREGSSSSTNFLRSKTNGTGTTSPSTARQFDDNDVSIVCAASEVLVDCHTVAATVATTSSSGRIASLLSSIPSKSSSQVEQQQTNTTYSTPSSAAPSSTATATTSSQTSTAAAPNSSGGVGSTVLESTLFS